MIQMRYVTLPSQFDIAIVRFTAARTPRRDSRTSASDLARNWRNSAMT